MDPMRPVDTKAASGRSGPNVMLVVLAAIIAFVVVFVLRNDNETQIDFMLFDWDTTVRWSIFIALIIGIALDRAFSMWWRRRGKKKNSND